MITRFLFAVALFLAPVVFFTWAFLQLFAWWLS